MPSSACWPPAASGPVLTVSRPIFIGAFCAIAGIANVAAPASGGGSAQEFAAIDANGHRILPLILFSQSCAQFGGARNGWASVAAHACPTQSFLPFSQASPLA